MNDNDIKRAFELYTQGAAFKEEILMKNIENALPEGADKQIAISDASDVRPRDSSGFKRKNAFTIVAALLVAALTITASVLYLNNRPGILSGILSISDKSSKPIDMTDRLNAITKDLTLSLKELSEKYGGVKSSRAHYESRLSPMLYEFNGSDLIYMFFIDYEGQEVAQTAKPNQISVRSENLFENMEPTMTGSDIEKKYDIDLSYDSDYYSFTWGRFLFSLQHTDKNNIHDHFEWYVFNYYGAESPATVLFEDAAIGESSQAQASDSVTTTVHEDAQSSPNPENYNENPTVEPLLDINLNAYLSDLTRGGDSIKNILHKPVINRYDYSFDYTKIDYIFFPADNASSVINDQSPSYARGLAKDMCPEQTWPMSVDEFIDTYRDMGARKAEREDLQSLRHINFEEDFPEIKGKSEAIIVMPKSLKALLISDLDDGAITQNSVFYMANFYKKFHTYSQEGEFSKKVSSGIDNDPLEFLNLSYQKIVEKFGGEEKSVYRGGKFVLSFKRTNQYNQEVVYDLYFKENPKENKEALCAAFSCEAQYLFEGLSEPINVYKLQDERNVLADRNILVSSDDDFVPYIFLQANSLNYYRFHILVYSSEDEVSKNNICYVDYVGQGM